jgi:hypothetical protein
LPATRPPGSRSRWPSWPGNQTEINTATLIQQIAEGLRFWRREPVVRTPTMLGFQPFGAILAGAAASTISVRAALLVGGLGT